MTDPRVPSDAAVEAGTKTLDTIGLRVHPWQKDTGYFDVNLASPKFKPHTMDANSKRAVSRAVLSAALGSGEVVSKQRFQYVLSALAWCAGYIKGQDVPLPKDVERSLVFLASVDSEAPR